MTAIEWFTLIFAGSYLVLLNWLRLSLISLKKALDEEKTQTVWRVDEIYKRIDLHKSENAKSIKENSDMTHKCRREVEDKMAIITENHMTEMHVKEYVNSKIEPIKESIEEVKVGVKEGNKISVDLLSKVQVLLDRDK